MPEDRGRSKRGKSRVEESPEGSDNALIFALGAATGFAVSLWVVGRTITEGETGAVRGRIRESARSVADRLRPGRLRREYSDQRELTRLEDAVLDTFLRDDILSERAIDVGAISRGIIELSGSVHSRDEAELAVHKARRVPNVETVVNRLEIETDIARRSARGNQAEGGEMPGEWSGNVSGMGRKRQGDTEPDQRDDSQHILETSIEHSDRREFEEEGLAHSHTIMSSRPSPHPENPTNFPEDELDNQSPYGKHAVPQPEQPQELNTLSRVGEGVKPGIELRLEQADIPVKPHQAANPVESREENA
ncbi:MAG TPA: BON domain-containing protein [Longimicrobium sp.]